MPSVRHSTSEFQTADVNPGQISCLTHAPDPGSACKETGKPNWNLGARKLRSNRRPTAWRGMTTGPMSHISRNRVHRSGCRLRKLQCGTRAHYLAGNLRICNSGLPWTFGSEISRSFAIVGATSRFGNPLISPNGRIAAPEAIKIACICKSVFG